MLFIDRASTQFYTRMMTESSSKSAADIVTKFIIDLASIKLKYSSQKYIDSAAIDKVISQVVGSLIRDWSKLSVNVCSLSAFTLFNYSPSLSFRSLTSKSTAAAYINLILKKHINSNEK